MKAKFRIDITERKRVIIDRLKSVGIVQSRKGLSTFLKSIEMSLYPSDIDALIADKLIIELEGCNSRGKTETFYGLLNWYKHSLMAIEPKRVTLLNSYHITRKC